MEFGKALQTAFEKFKGKLLGKHLCLAVVFTKKKKLYFIYCFIAED